MGFLDFVLGFSAEAPSIFPHDANDERAWRSSGNREFWGGHSGGTSTGLYVRPDDAIGVSCVFLGLSIWAGVLGASPIKFYRNLPRDEGEAPLYDHPLLSLLSTDGIPNPWQTGIQWRMWSEAQRHLWGLGLSEIKFGMDGMELWPIEAEHIAQVDHLKSGKVRFNICEPGEPSRQLMQDQVLRLEGFGTHKLIPESLLRRCREAVGVWLAQQQYRGTYFERGASPSIIFQHPGLMSDKALARFKSQVQGRVGGNRNAHKALVTEEGITVKEYGHTARNAQLVEAWDSQAIEVARWMSIPPYMLGVSTQLPYNSRESAAREWLNLHARPRARMTEASIKRDLIVEKGVVCELDLSQLERGDALAQAQVDAIHILNGIRSEDEVRRDYGWNAYGSGPPQRSVNQGKGGNDQQGGDPRQPQPGNPGDRQTKSATATAAAQDNPTDILALLQVPGAPPVERTDPLPVDQSAVQNALRYSRVIEASARQLFNRETVAIRRHAIQHASNPTAWSLWLTEFYKRHSEAISESLALDAVVTKRYTDSHRAEVEQQGISVLDSWEKDEQAVREMISLATGEQSI